jgi:hypothetical protein
VARTKKTGAGTPSAGKISAYVNLLKELELPPITIESRLLSDRRAVNHWIDQASLEVVERKFPLGDEPEAVSARTARMEILLSSSASEAVFWWGAYARKSDCGRQR